MTKEEILESRRHIFGNALLAALSDTIINMMDEYAEQMEMYWKSRCLAAEDYISETPCDPDITAEQIEACEKWNTLVDQEDKVMTKEEIYDKWMDEIPDGVSYMETDVSYPAMDEYAKQQAIAFADWLHLNYQPLGEGGYWYDHHNDPVIKLPIPTSELYQKFIEQQNKA